MSRGKKRPNRKTALYKQIRANEARAEKQEAATSRHRYEYRHRPGGIDTTLTVTQHNPETCGIFTGEGNCMC